MACLADNLENHFREKNSLPDNFYFYRWICMPLDGPTIYYELQGGICELFERGPRKGKPNYSTAKETKVFWMTVDEYRKLFN